MAGDWIKIESSLPYKPEVYSISEQLNCNKNETLGMLLIYFSWLDQHSKDGKLESYACNMIDDIVSRKGFFDALINVGWLKQNCNGYSVTNFEKHLSNSAKSRSSANQRVKKHRAKKDDNCNGKGVTKALPEKRREEKRRKESIKPSLQDVKSYISEKNFSLNAEEFFDFYESKNWMIGKNKMKDYKAAIRNWERNANSKQNNQRQNGFTRNNERQARGTELFDMASS